MKQRRILLPLMILLLFLLFNISYAVDVTECQEINESGYYELINDVNVTSIETCFNITTDNVIFNCNHNKIFSSDGITVLFYNEPTFSNSNFTIYNCNVENIDKFIYMSDVNSLNVYNINLIEVNNGIVLEQVFRENSNIRIENLTSVSYCEPEECWNTGTSEQIYINPTAGYRNTDIYLKNIYINGSTRPIYTSMTSDTYFYNITIENHIETAITMLSYGNHYYEKINISDTYVENDVSVCYAQDGWGESNTTLKDFYCYFNGNAGGIDIIISKDIMLDNVTISGSGTGTGIIIDSNEYTTMKDIKLSNLNSGISLIISSNNTSIMNSDFTDISAGCINLGNTLSNVSVIGNNFTNCTYGIRTINFDYLDYLLIENNTFNSNRFSVYLTEDKISEIHIKNNEIKMYSGRYGILIDSDTDLSYVTDNKVFLNTSLQQNPFYFDIEKYYNLTFKDNVVDNREYLYYYDNCPPVIDLSGKSGIIAHCNDTIIGNLNGNSYMTYGNNVTGYNIITNNCRMCLIMGGYNQTLRDAGCNNCLSNQLFSYDTIRWINVSAVESVFDGTLIKEWYVNIRTSDNSRLKIYVDNEYKGISPIMLILPQKIVNITGEYDISNHSFKAEGKGYKSELKYYVINNNKDIVLEVENVVGVTTYQVAIPIINNIFIIFLLLIAVPILYKVFGKELMILYLLILAMVVLMLLSVVI